jgi:hypothetical protein
MADADYRAQRRAKAGKRSGILCWRALPPCDRPKTAGVFSLWEIDMRKSEKAAARDAAGLQAQLAEAWSQQASRSGETYGRLFAAMRDEFTGFVHRRLDANLATVREWSECRSLNDLLELQQRWVQSAVEQYVDQGNRVLETCRLAATDIIEAAQPRTEAGEPVSERKPAPKPRLAESDVKKAA